MTIHYGEDPFAVPPEHRDAARRLRGRIVAPVTAWTAYDADGTPTSITVASILVAEGDPASVLGLIDPLSVFWEAVSATKRWVVHVLAEEHRRMADQLAGRYPGPDARFAGLALSSSAWGPILDAATSRAYCSLGGIMEVGDALLVRGDIDEVDLGDEPQEPLAYFRGAYHGIRARRSASEEERGR